MKLIDLLELSPGVISIIGSGGKTSLMYRLTEETAGKTVICTSTHIMPPDKYPVSDPTAEELARQLEHFPAVCIGRPAKEGKLTAPSLSWPELSELADYVIIEADGSRRLPLKAHASHEPVIPECTGIVIQVVGCSGFGKPISEVCHRPERFAGLAGCSITDIAEPQMAAKVIDTEGFADLVFLNQLDLPGAEASAQEFIKGITVPVFGGSLQEGIYKCLY